MRNCFMGLFIGAVGLFLMNSGPATAQKGLKKAVNQNLVTQLESIRTTLNMANHDYAGHRAAAVHHITHAIHITLHAKPHPNPGEHFRGAKAGSNEPQNVSDAQLQTAMTALQSVTVPATNKHQAKVQEHLTKAISELQTALKVN